jgi:hypothetical protein
MGSLMQDLRYTIRLLAKNPGFAAVAVLTLALGIGANTAIFSVVNGLLLHPVGVSHPEQLVAIRVRYEKLDLKSIEISAPDFNLMRENTGFCVRSAGRSHGFQLRRGNLAAAPSRRESFFAMVPGVWGQAATRPGIYT